MNVLAAKRVMPILSVAFILFLASCTPKPIDPTTSTILSDMAKRTDKYFQALIKDYGTEKCRYSSKDGQMYWKAINGDLRVIDARMANIPKLREIEPEYEALKKGFTAVEDELEFLDLNPAKLANGAPSYCLPPDALTQKWINIESTLRNLSKVSNFN